jgi:putative endonuclease
MLGEIGEEIACRYFVSKQFVILDRNYYSRFGEIDIIAAKDRQLVICEVKTRNTCASSSYYKLDKYKSRRLSKTFHKWLSSKKGCSEFNCDVTYLALCINLYRLLKLRKYYM